MTPATFELMLIAARSIVRDHEVGRIVDPHSLEWARTLLASNAPRPADTTTKQEQA